MKSVESLSSVDYSIGIPVGKMMLAHFVWIVFIDEDWNVHPFGYTRKHLLLALSAELGKIGSMMLCVERPLSLVTLWRNREGVQEAMRGQRGLRQVAEHLYLTTPWMFLHERLAPMVPEVVQLNQMVLGRQVEHALHRLGKGEKKRIAWIFHPYQKDMIGVADEQLLVYECYDEYAALAALLSSARVATVQRICENENCILEQADIVLTTAQHLYETRKKRNDNTYLVQNGVAYDLFATALEPGLPLPRDVAGISCPRIGYAGAINGLLDFEIINSVARDRPDWNFLFLGPNNGNQEFQDRPDFLAAQQIPNIHFLGHRPYEQVPAYLKAFDACIMPYVANDGTIALYPLKLNEYLAAGRPVVCTDFVADMKEFSDVVRIVNTGDWQGFQRALEMAMQSDERRRERGLEIARANSWTERAKLIINIVARHMPTKFSRGYSS
jgi:glycosyltransferase involved in cell wall biosynthesis